MASTTTTSGGTVTSFSNTPQAKDDIFTTTENLLGVVYWDVMSNDLGGNAKTLWSLDNADSLSTATKTYAPADLLTQDTARAEATSSDTSLNGAKIWITSDGKVGYDAATFSDAFKAQLQALATGELLTDSFTYAIRLGNGTLSWATATVQFSGENDGVTISLGAQAGTVTEDANTTASTTDSLTASGTITFNDVDLSDTHMATFAPAGGNATHLGTFVLSPVSEAANVVNGSVQWTYNLNNAAAQYLAQGQTVTETYLVTISDGHGSSVTQNVTITITGTNDAPTVTAAEVESGAVTEDGTPLASGSFAFGDVDLADDAHVASVSAPSGALGTLVAHVSDESTGDAAGSVGWTYTLSNSAAQYLAAGQTKTEVFTVTLTDDVGAAVTKNVTITLTGTNDAPTVTAAEVESGAVTEDSTTVASGSFAFGDVDLADDAHVASVSAPAGALGTLVAHVSDESTGDAAGSVGWTYTLNNSAAQYLAAGQIKTEVFTVTLTDDFGAAVTKNVTITLTGTNDAPTVTAAEIESGAVTEDGTPVASGSFAFGDVDLADDAHVASVSAPSGALGSLVAHVSDESTGDAAGSVGWTYTLNNSAAQYLAAGQTKTEVFTVTLTDDVGAAVTKNVTITLTGTNDAPTVTAAELESGAVTEDGTPVASGSFAFGDVDLADDAHVASVSAPSGALGTLVATVSDESTGDAAGSVGWTYTLNNSAAQYLAAGQTKTEVFTVTLTDDVGAAVTKNVTITLTGTNDAPTVTAAELESGAVTEDGTPVASGSFAFGDVDLADDAHVASVSAPSGALGTLVATVSDESTGDAAGSVGWTYTLNNSAAQYLAEGQTKTEVFTVTLTDDFGAAVTKNVTITLTGTNDQPTLTIGDTTGAMNEGNGAATLSDSGALSFADLDVNDAVTVSQTANHDLVWSGGTLGAAQAAALVAGFSVDQAGWTYSSNQNLDFLSAGETISFSYTVVATDDSGTGNATSAPQMVTITLTGTNDAPVLSFATGNDAGAVQEDTTLSVTGQFSSADIDHDATATWTINGSSTGIYGAIAVDNTGQWIYTLANGSDGVASAVQSLQAGESHDDVFTVQVSDGLGGVDTQLVTITITGTNDAPTVTAAEVESGAVTEDGTTVAGGSFAFGDVDLADDAHVASVSAPSGALGTLVATVSDESTGDAAGSVGWTYTLNNSAAQYLAEGQTKTEVFTVTLTDDFGAAVTKNVTITLTGTNDQPTLTIGDTTGAMNEGNGAATLSDSGALSFADLDVNDAVTVSQSANHDIAWSGGTLGSAQAAALVAGFSVDQAGWTYSSSENLDFLSAGETISFSYTVVASDDSGAGNATSATQTVTISITGSNDAPVLSFATGNAAGAVQEDTTLSVTGQFSSADIDHDATATWTINGSSTGTYGAIAVDTTGQWTYTLANGTDGVASAVQSLKAGESHDDVFTVQVSDGLGGVDTQLVTVTISGSNDAPVLSFATGNAVGAVQEDSTLSVTGQFSSADIDHDATATWSIAGTDTGTYGAIAVDTTGQWTYTLANGTDGVASAVQALKAGESHEDVFTVQVSDGLGGVDTQLVTVTISGSNDAPVLSFATGNAAGAVQEDTKLSVNGQFSSTDIDHDATATWTINGSSTGTYGSIAVDTTGQWTYTLANGTDGVASAVQALKAGESHEDVFTVQVSDGLGGVDTQLVTVTITGSNDAPVLSFATGNAAGAVQEDTALSVTGQFISTDIDHDATATWTINGSSTGTYGSIAVDTTGQWTYTLANGTDGVASAVQSLQAGESHEDVFTVQVSDGLGGEDTQLVTVTITGSNDAPVLSFATGNAAGAVQEDTALSVNGQFSSTDIDHDATATWTINGSSTGTYGSIAVDTTGQWTYTLANGTDGVASAVQSLKAGESHEDVFTVQVSDGLGGEDTQLVTVTITGSNDAPVLSFATGNAAGAVQEDTALSVTGQFSSADIDHDATATWTINGSSTGTYGAIAVDTTGQWTYTLANGTDGVASAVQSLQAGESHEDVFTVQVSDGLGGEDTQLVTVTISGSNDAPVLSFATGNAAGAVQEDTTLSVTGQFSSADIDHDATATWTINGSSTGTYGAIAVDTTGQWTYTLANGTDGVASAVQSLKAGESHDDVFTVQVSDGLGGVDTQLVTVTVSGSNDAPVLSFATGNAVGAVQEDSTLSVTGQFSSADIDHDATATWSIAGSNTGTFGSIAVDSSGQWTYTLANGTDGVASAVQSLQAGESHDDVFTVQVSDGLGCVDTQLVTVTISGSNDAPVLSFATGNAAGAVQEDITLSVNGQFSSTDIDHDATATWSINGSSTGTYGAIAVDTTGQWTYTLANGTDGVASAVQSLKAGESHDDVFTVQVSDGLGGVDTQLVTVTVSGSNDAPVLSFATGNAVGAVQEDSTLSVTGQFSSADIDHDATATWSIAGTDTGTYGAIAVDTTGQWTYTLANGTDGVASAVQALKAGESHEDVFTVQVSDGLGGVDTQLVTVTISGSNDAPVLSFATGNAAGAVQEDTKLSVSGQFSSADIDHDATATWSIAGTDTGTYGAIAVDTTGQWTYTLANGTDGVASAVQSLKAGESHDDVFTVQVSDGLGGVDTQLVTVTISGSNDAPVLSFATGNAAGAVQEDTTLSVTGQFSSADIDHDATATWSIAGTDTGTYGAIAVDNSGQWTYTLANGTDGVASAVQSLQAGESHDDVFTVQVSDGLGGVDTQLVTVTITGTNDAPTVTAAEIESGAVTEDGTTTASGSFAFGDVDLADDAHVASVSAPSGALGSLVAHVSDESTGDAAGSVGWTYTLNNSAAQYLAEGQTKTEVFTVTLTDDFGAAVTKNVTITLTGTNDAPTVTAAEIESGAVTEDGTTTASGSFAFGDVDLADDAHVASVSAPSGALGSLVAHVSDESTGDAAGSVGWTYTLNNSAAQYLAEGQTKTEVFTVTLTDDFGAAVTKNVTITLTGANDAPTVTAAEIESGAVTEDSTPVASGSFAFGDVDLADDAHVASVSAPSGALGTLVATVSDESTGDAAGSVGWTYTLNNSAAQYLAAGQTKTEVFTVTLTDDFGAAVTKDVTITLTGTNDSPDIHLVTSDSAAASLTETNAGLSSSGTLTVTDADLADTVNSAVTVVLASGTTAGLNLTNAQLLSMLSVAPTSGLAANSGDTHNLTWSFNSGSQAFDYLAAGQSLTLSYTLQSTDNNATSDTQTVTVTINGTNDSPDIHLVTSDSAAASLTETNAGLSSSGTLTVTDADLADTVSSAVTVVLASGTTAGLNLTNAQLLSMLSVAPTSGLAANSGDTHNLSWSFNSGSQAFDYLAAGQSLTLSYTLQSTDNNAASDTQTVTVTINGTNDNPDIHLVTSDSAAASLTETNAGLSSSGTLTVTDADLADTVNSAVTVVLASGTTAGLNLTNAQLLSMLSVAPTSGLAANSGDTHNLTWSFNSGSQAFDYLAAGQSLTLSYTLQSTDNNAASDMQTVTVTINGTNDGPVAVNDTGSATEKGGTNNGSGGSNASGNVLSNDIGSLVVSAIRLGGTEGAGTVGTLGSGLTGAHGTLTLNANGSYTYMVNDSEAAVQALNVGGTLTDSFNYTVSDGSQSDTAVLTITIQGANDAPVANDAMIWIGTNWAGGSSSGTASASDAEQLPGTLNYSLVSGLSGLSFGPLSTFNSNGSYFFGFGSSTTGTTDHFTFRATDSGGLSDDATVTFLRLNSGATYNLTGLDGNDILFAPASGGTANGGAGDDYLQGGAGNDTFIGGEGVDTLLGGAGNDIINGTQNDALLDGGANTDTLNVSENFISSSDGQITNIENVTLTTGGLTLNLGNQSEAFNINGSSGVDTISGGSAADTLNGQAGNDTLTGNGGVDQFRLRTNGGMDTITDYTDNSDKIGLLGGAVTGGVGFQTVGSSAGTTLLAADFQTRNTISTINNPDDNSVVVIQNAQTTSDITTSNPGNATNTYAIVFNSTTGKGEIWFDSDWNDVGSRVQVATLNNVTSLAGITAITASDIVVYDSTFGPAGVAGSPINLGLADAVTRADVATVTISGLPADWTLNQGAHNDDGSWTVDKHSLDTLTVTTPADFVGAMVLPVTMTWTNADGTVDSEVIRDNVEAYAPGSPIFALSADDNLTGSSGADLFVFAQPIGNNVIHSFDAAADKIDLIGFTGVNDFADVSIANDASGNAVLSISADQTITVNGVDAAALSAANLLFDADPVTTNRGTITIADGAIMPFGGSIDNSGTIELGSTGSGTDLEILFRGATLTGGGQVVLSDSAQNVIFGGSADTVLTNADNTLSGAGQLGAGQMMLVNSGLILASGVNALVIDTGSSAVTNTGVLQASGSGGLVIESALLNSGSLWANDGNIIIHADASGAGSATISGSATLEFAAASDQHVTFDSGAAGTLKLDVSAAFSGSVSGFAAGDTLEFGDVAFGANTQITYAANDTGTGGMLSVSDGAHVAQVALNGQYAAAGLQANAESSGSELAYDAAAANHTMLGGLANDILIGGAGDDLFLGGLGNDTLNGGLGNDTFVFAAAGFGNDSIQGFDVNPTGGQDLLNIAGLGISSETFAANVSIAADGADTVIGIGVDSIRLVGVNSAGIDQTDFILTA